MISPRPFQAHQFALLHLIGILSLSRCREACDPNESLNDNVNLLILPQEVIINAYCYLTEQIHEVSKPPPSLQDIVADVYSLSTTLLVPPVPAPASVFKSSPTTGKPVTRRSSARSPSKRSSTSPAASTRSLRRSTSRATFGTSAAPSETSSVTPPPQVYHLASAPLAEDPTQQEALLKIDGVIPDRTRATYALADRLHKNVLADLSSMKEERSDMLYQSLGEFKVLIGELDDPNNNAFLDRSSPLGLWARRAILNVRMMQFSESEQLIDDMLQWANLSEPTKPKRDLEEVISFSVSTAAHSDRDSLQTRTELFEAYQEAMRKEDYALSLDLMQRFFDYETHPLAGGSSANRGVRQHALLNLAQFHYIHEEYAAAKLAANEGMKIARHASDLIALNALTSLVKKLTFEDSSDRLEYRDGAHADAPSIETSREDPGGYVPPADYVWDVRYGLSTRIPLPSLMFDLLRAKALHYFAANQKMNLSSKERRKEKKLAAQQGKDSLVTGADVQQRRLRWNRLDAIGWLATSADLWERMGYMDLAHAYQVMGCIVKRGDINPFSGAKMALRCKRAEELANQGLFDTALVTLLAEVMHPARMHLTVRDIQTWIRAIYTVLRIQAERSENDSLVQEIDSVCPPAVAATDFPRRVSSGAPASTLGFPTIECEPTTESGLIGEIDSFIRRAEKYLEIDQAAAALPLAVKAYALSSIGDGQGLLSLHRRSGLALVRVQVAFRTCDRALRILNEFWSDILPSLDDDLIAYAKEVRADTLMALVDVVVEERQSADKDGDEASLEAALLLKEAAELRSRLGEPSKHISTLKKLAMLYNRMGDIPARDKVAKECRLASNSWYASRSQIHHQQIQRFAHMQRICVNVGAAVAAS